MAAFVYLDVYGLQIALEGDWHEVREALRLDYSWFETASPPASAEVTAVVERASPGFDAFADAEEWFVTPRNTVYRLGQRIVVDHLGSAVSVIDRRGDRLWIQGEDEHIVHDAVYYFLLGRIGQHLDRCGLIRLHALGLVGAQGAVALLLPSGGGKTTLALEALRADKVFLLSEDSPLLDRRGRLHPFPLRIGVNATDATRLPDGEKRRIERLWLHPKVAVEVESFADRVAPEPRPLRHLVVGRRSLGRSARLEPLARGAAIAPLLRDGVLGAGLYQGLGFAHQRGLDELVGKLWTASRRARACTSALAGAETWRLTLSQDAERNWAALQPLLG